MYSMDTVLDDNKLFKDKFCADATFCHLQSVPLDALRETVRRIHIASGFRAAATAEYWTPNGSEQSVVTFGRPTRSGAMSGFRFGLTSDVRASEQNFGQSLFLWVPAAEIKLIASLNEHLDFRFIFSWLPWRDCEEAKFLAMPVPMYKDGQCLNLSDTVAGFNDCLTLEKFLELLGRQLNLRPEVKGSFSEITEKLGLLPDVITPAAAEIMRNS